MLSQFGDLFPQFGDGGGLPEATLTSRSHRVERLRNSATAADECSVEETSRPRKSGSGRTRPSPSRADIKGLTRCRQSLSGPVQLITRSTNREVVFPLFRSR